MRKITIVCVGNLKEKFWVDAVEEYKKRLSRFFEFKIIEINETKIAGKQTEANIQKSLETEAQKMQTFLQGKIVVPLSIEGKQLSSFDFAKFVKQQSNNVELCFVIGSSFGLSQTIKKLGTNLSFGKITLPHQLMRVVLCEQIYRAATILNNIEYHK